MQTREKLLHDLPIFLLPWYRQNRRNLPWRRDTDPYRILVSEVMLQQTRVEAVIDKYNQFMNRLPTIKHLANCQEQDLLKLWEGLGYYSRARNLQKAAQDILQNGFPTKAEELIKLKGVGSYTAGAIASIAFEEPSPAVDGNVIRVLSRYLHDEIEQDILRERYFTELKSIYPIGSCGDFTQSLMELGATVCTPKSPTCLACPLLQNCQTKGASLPLKKIKPLKKEQHYTLLLFHDSDTIALLQRTDGVLKNLFGFYMLENAAFHDSPKEKSIIDCYLQQFGLSGYCIDTPKEHKHIFTHIIWHMMAYPIYLPNCKQQLQTLPAFANLQFFNKSFIEENISLPSAFRWCLSLV